MFDFILNFVKVVEERPKKCPMQCKETRSLCAEAHLSLSDLSALEEKNILKTKNHQELLHLGLNFAQLAHQMKSPLTAAGLYLEHLSTEVHANPKAARWTKQLQACLSSIQRQVEDFLLYARAKTVTPEWVDLKEWCQILWERAEPWLGGHALLSIHNQVGDQKVYIQSESLLGALLNLMMNAIQAKASQINLSITKKDQSCLEFKVVDNGKGMSQRTLLKAFDLFFTTKLRGNGLGLAVVAAVVNAHKGDLTVTSRVGQGTCISIRLPALSYSLLNKELL